MSTGIFGNGQFVAVGDICYGAKADGDFTRVYSQRTVYKLHVVVLKTAIKTII